MKKIIWILIGIVIALAFIFYPKDAGSTCGMCEFGKKMDIRNDCYGFLVDGKQTEPCMDCGILHVCYGIIGKQRCYGTINNETVDLKEYQWYLKLSEIDC